MIGYANHVMIIFLNIDSNVRDESKMVIKLRGCTYKSTHIVSAHSPRLPHLVPTKNSEYDQETPQSQTADNPVAPRGRAAQPSRDTRKTN